MARAGITFDEDCPAHAGIDPFSLLKEAVDAGLPRARGDRPHARFKERIPEMTAPRTRGSTLPPIGLS